jgi:hypothetical protein
MRGIDGRRCRRRARRRRASLAAGAERQVGGDRRFADTALAGGDRDDRPDPRYLTALLPDRAVARSPAFSPHHGRRRGRPLETSMREQLSSAIRFPQLRGVFADGG